MFKYAVLAALACLSLASPSRAADQSFQDWLAQVKTDAVAAGLDQAVVDKALADVQPIDKVIENDRKQSEFTLTFEQYMERVVSDKRVKDGRERLAKNRAAIEKIAAREGVPAGQIVAMWGIESDYGRAMGNFHVLSALATLAYDGRRSAFFRGELMKALTMVSQGVPPDHMQGSWAGAMGQCQFMPSTYLNFAQSNSGQGPADIWSNSEDVWASTAHYLASLNWKRDEGWGMAVKLPKHGMAEALYGLERARPARDWERLGLRTLAGRKLPGAPERRLALIHADAGRDGTGGTGPVFLVGGNFRAIMQWNRSFFFALAAGSLADRIASR